VQVNLKRAGCIFCWLIVITGSPRLSHGTIVVGGPVKPAN
jgi:hypothetical protein